MKLKCPKTLIGNAFLLVTTQQAENNRRDERKSILFIPSFNKNNLNIYREIILSAYHNLRLVNPFSNYKFIKGFRQSNLQRILNNNDDETFNESKCNESRYGC